MNKNYTIKNNKIYIKNSVLNILQTLECGQVFSYKKTNENNYIVLSADKKCKIIKVKNETIITPQNILEINYWINYFDLNNNYDELKKQLFNLNKLNLNKLNLNNIKINNKTNKISENELKINNKLNNYLINILNDAIIFGNGIRILKQDIFETIISFIISANNNIKRIQKILFIMREKIGTNFNFPTLEQMSKKNEQFFKDIGCGYRAKYLENICRQLKNVDLNSLKDIDLNSLKKYLISLSGIGPKVADCVLLFGFGKQNVFPVDTWIEKVFVSSFGIVGLSRERISEILVQIFGELSGVAQQYLFYFAQQKKLL
ncbi:MAG: DNA glycosylase [Clostridia bacterium]